MGLGQYIPTKYDLAREADETGLRSSIIHNIRHAASNAPRSLQKRIGPSQLGTSCARKLAFEMSDIPPSRDLHDPWPSIMGTAGHAWLADTMEAANPPPPAPKVWIPEQRVDVGFGVNGSSDVYHVPTGTVIDWKLLGDTTYRKYARTCSRGCAAEHTFDGGDCAVYRDYYVQAHTYGLGFARAGYDVKRVAIAYFGRAKRLSDLYIWSEPWDITVALRALNRMLKVQDLQAQGVHPMQFPAKESGACFFCSYKGSKPGYCQVGKGGPAS